MTPAKPKTSRREAWLRFEMLNAFVDTGIVELSRAGLAVWLILHRKTQRNGVARASLDDVTEKHARPRRFALEGDRGDRSIDPLSPPCDKSCIMSSVTESNTDNCERIAGTETSGDTDPSIGRLFRRDFLSVGPTLFPLGLALGRIFPLQE